MKKLVCVLLAVLMLSACAVGTAYADELNVIDGSSELPSVTLPDTKTDASKYSVTLGKTSYVYDGKLKYPSVTVKDNKGRKLARSCYDLKYTANKYVGTACVAITYKGNYTGAKKMYYKIVPKGTSITKLTRGKKSFTVKWKKQTIQTTGYQVVYSTSKSFKNPVYKSVNNKKAVSKTVTKLKKNKTYYVKVRTIAKKNGKTYYSAYSKTLKVKTK